MPLIIRFLCVCILWTGAVVDSETVKVQLSTGTIEGKTINATYSPFGPQSGIAFLGIPYAEAPLGDLRFKKPRPPVPWNGVRDAKEYGAACMSDPKRTFKSTGNSSKMSEDCLHANIFTNQYCMTSQNCSVMVIIHGGAFLYQSAITFDPDTLINNFVGQGRNIVVVTLNYRLGVFGFGNLNGEEGEEDQNVGLYDILSGVKWIRKEIHNFGGDKNRITLAGHSGGAISTALFSMSPLSKGLIHQQIIMSAPFPTLSKQCNFKATTVVAEIVGCLDRGVGFGKLSKEQVEETYSCLRSKPSHQLLSAQMYLLQNTTYHFDNPHIDGVFITDYADITFSKKLISPINTLIGTTTAEFRKTQFLEENPQKMEILRGICEHIGYELYSDPMVFVSQCVAHYKKEGMARYLSDDLDFYSYAIEIANAHSSNDTKVFVYSYNYTGAGQAYTRPYPHPSPGHSEDLIYAYGKTHDKFLPKDYKIEQIYSGIFANFINFGDPSPSDVMPWVQYSPEKKEHFLIDFDEEFRMPGVRIGYHEEAWEFWSQTPPKSHKEHWAPSLDSFYTLTLMEPIMSHFMGFSTDTDKSYDVTEQLYYERIQFLEELKGHRTLKMKNLEIEENPGVPSLLIIIIPCAIFVIGVICITMTSYCLRHKKRAGYQLLD